MLPYFSEVFGNPASVTHPHGRRAATALEDARIAVARVLGAQPAEIYFTAGATESNNTVLSMLSEGEHLVTSAIEHSSILAPARELERRGVTVTLLRPDAEGFITPEAVAGAIRAETRLVSIEAANGEIGTIQPFAEIGALCRGRGVLFHSDITQAAGKIAVDPHASSIDLASFSGHKIYGPKGIGGLFIRRGVRVEPLIRGGGQEKKIRAGTVNVPGVVGIAAALMIRADEMQSEAERLASIRDEMRERIVSEITGVSVNGPRAVRLPGNLNVSFEKVDAESLMLAMRHFSLSSGSACSSGERGPSRVLLAIGVSEAMAMGSIRIGLGKTNTAEQAAKFVDDLKRAIARLREISAA